MKGMKAVQSNVWMRLLTEPQTFSRSIEIQMHLKSKVFDIRHSRLIILATLCHSESITNIRVHSTTSTSRTYTVVIVCVSFNSATESLERPWRTLWSFSQTVEQEGSGRRPRPKHGALTADRFWFKAVISNELVLLHPRAKARSVHALYFCREEQITHLCVIQKELMYF